jgi:hypothetical protein
MDFGLNLQYKKTKKENVSLDFVVLFGLIIFVAKTTVDFLVSLVTLS